MKMKIAKAVALVLAMVCIFCFPVPASATAQGTDGTEMEVIQPQNLEIQLGESWAGVEFELKTDAGMYPGVITVGEDGVLRLEIGGSENYILSCLNSSVEIPEPGETVPADVETAPEEQTGTEASEDVEASADPSEGTGAAETEPSEDEEQGTVAGIPVMHMALFGGGLVVAIGALVGIHFYQKRSGSGRESDDDDEDL